MALRLRRGTNTDRLTATFAEGELVYVTDYDSAGVSPLWIGDGSTAGGNEIETGGTPSLALDDLTDVVIPSPGPSINEVLAYVGGQWTNTDPSTLGLSGTLDNLTDVSVPAPSQNNILAYIGSQWTSVAPESLITGTGVVEGTEYAIDIQGNVNGTDSTLIIDASSRTVTANLFIGSGAGLTDINLVDLDDVFAYGAVEDDVLTYNGTGWVPAPSQGIQPGQLYEINIEGNVLGFDSSVIVNATTGVLTGQLTGNVTGNVTGNLIGDVTGSVFADDSTVIIDAPTSTVFGNFIGNLVGDIESETISYATGLNLSNINTGAISTVNLQNTGEAQYLKFSRTDTGTVGNQTMGLIAFDQTDDTGTTTYTSMAFWHSGIYIANSATGSFSATNYLGFENGNLCVGDYSAEAGFRLDVKGNTIIRGDVTASAFIGSVMADDSTTIIDGIDGNITAPGYVQFGSFTTTERNAITAAAGMVIWNTTTSQFEGFNGTNWINLVDGVISA